MTKRLNIKRVSALFWVAAVSCNLGHEVARNQDTTLKEACEELCRKDSECGTGLMSLTCSAGDCSDCVEACIEDGTVSLDLDDEFCITLLEAAADCAQNASCTEFMNESGHCARMARARSACVDDAPPAEHSASVNSGVVSGSYTTGVSSTTVSSTTGVSSTSGFVSTGTRRVTVGPMGTGGYTMSPSTGGAVTTGAAGWGQAGATTGALANCSAQLFLNNCSTSACHGTPEDAPSSLTTYLFPNDPIAAFVNVPGKDCPNALLIDSEEPSNSLLITTLRHTDPCGVSMPSEFLKLPNDQIACVESWVNDLVSEYNAGIE